MNGLDLKIGKTFCIGWRIWAIVEYQVHSPVRRQKYARFTVKGLPPDLFKIWRKFREIEPSPPYRTLGEIENLTCLEPGIVKFTEQLKIEEIDLSQDL